MSIRIGINGMGRVGRALLRRAAQTDDLEVVAVNDVMDVATLANLLRRDSTFGRFAGEIEVDGDVLVVDGRKIAVSSVRDPERAAVGPRARRRSPSSAPASSARATRLPGTCVPEPSGSSSPPPASPWTPPS